MGKADDAKKFPSRRRIASESAEHPARHHGASRLIDAAHAHALMAGIDHDGNTARLEDVVKRIGDLRRHLLLNLQPFGKAIEEAGEFADADDPVTRQIRNMRMTDDRRKVMLAMAFEAHVFKDDHFVVTVGFFEGAL